MAFYQSPPTLDNQYRDDRVLRSYLSRALPREVLCDIEGSLDEMGALAGGPLYQLQLADRLNEPRLTSFDPWGNRIDQIEITPLWKEAARLAATHGLVATGYGRRHGRFDRIHQFALVHLFDGSTDVYSCPLAMTDGAAKTLLSHKNQALIDRAVPRLTSRDPEAMWTSGQWMTERTGGSDVGLSETVARRDGDLYRLYGTKWFTSAATSQMALTLARPEGNGPGGRGLALFYLETRDARGVQNHITTHRLKDKLGTRKVPTAELLLDGTIAVPVCGLDQGVRNIAPMLNITRTWNAVCAVASMRRGLALCRDYARRRHAFGARLADKPLHQDTLAGLQAEYEALFHLTFRAVELLGAEEAGQLSAGEAELWRLMVPIIKLTTGRQAVASASEVLEAFGGAGYVEDTGLPRLLRDAQVLPIWEGTTNVLSLDVLRVLSRGEPLAALGHEIERLGVGLRDPLLRQLFEAARAAIGRVHDHLAAATGPAALEAGARRLALTLGRSLALALLASHAQHCLDHEQDARPRAAARRFAQHGIDLIGHGEAGAESAALAEDVPQKPGQG